MISIQRSSSTCPVPQWLQSDVRHLPAQLRRHYSKRVDSSFDQMVNVDLVDGSCHSVHEELEVLPSQAAILCKCLPQVSLLFHCNWWRLHTLDTVVSQDKCQARGHQHGPRPRICLGFGGPTQSDNCHGCGSRRMLASCCLLYFVAGADVIHPAPGSDGRPSFTALVANVDSDTAKYIADSRVQTSRQEMIEDLQAMAKVRVVCPTAGLMTG
jgi:hypothetical protein